MRASIHRERRYQKRTDIFKLRSTLPKASLVPAAVLIRCCVRSINAWTRSRPGVLFSGFWTSVSSQRRDDAQYVVRSLRPGVMRALISFRECLLVAESGRSEMDRERLLTTQSGRSSNRRNGYECSLPDYCNTRLADSCTAQRYFRYAPKAALLAKLAKSGITWQLPLIH